MTIISKETSAEELSDFDKTYAVIYDGYVQSYLNPIIVEEYAISVESQQYQDLKKSKITELKIFQKMEITTNETHLIKLDHLYIKNQFSLQRLWNKKENANEHKFWKAPNCKCPKESNENKHPEGNYTISDDCLIHRHRNFTI